MTDRPMILTIQQIWQVLFLVVYVVGVILALYNRGIGKASSYAALGFGALAISQCVSLVQSYIATAIRLSETMPDVERFAAISSATFALRTVFQLCGMGLLMAAIFVKRPAPDPSRL